MVHVYNGILLSHKKGWVWVSCNEVDAATLKSFAGDKEEKKKKKDHKERGEGKTSRGVDDHQSHCQVLKRYEFIDMH